MGLATTADDAQIRMLAAMRMAFDRVPASRLCDVAPRYRPGDDASAPYRRLSIQVAIERAWRASRAAPERPGA